MTMRITKHQKIGGVSALDARKVLRKYHERFREDWLEEALSELLFRRKFGHGNLTSILKRRERCAARPLH
jgi:hypothetical protein